MSAEAPLALITSAAYVNAELAAEFGPLPPAFLPFGHQRLYQAQVESLAALDGPGGRIVLTLPASFQPDAWDVEWLAARGVQVVLLPDGLTLGDSIARALILADARGPLRLLHGDTLFTAPLDGRSDAVTVAQGDEAYHWGQLSAPAERGAEADDRVLTGWFSLSSAPELLRSLVRAGQDFVGALNHYADGRPLERLERDDWLDFGHLQTFYRARARVSTARSFNALTTSANSVLKTGGAPGKLDAEAAWFESIPPALRLHTPPFLGREAGGYRLGYEVSPTLHELFVFGRLQPGTWRRILGGCFEFLAACRAHASPRPERDGLVEMMLAKTEARLTAWAEATGAELDAPWRYAGRELPPLREVASAAAAIAAESSPIPGVMHGDFCFPNLFFSFRHGLIRVIDPRGGLRDDQPDVYGDLRYDLAKLNHSLEGYDLILAGRYMLHVSGERDLRIGFPPEAGAVSGAAREFEIGGQRISDPAILAMTVHLFLSMLPLHADRPDRQQAFLANALRLFSRLEAVR